MEIQYSGNILKYMKVVLIKSPNNEGDSPSWIFLVTKSIFQYWDRLYSIEQLTKVVPWKPPTTQAVAKMIDYSPQTDSKVQVLKETSTQHTEQRGGTGAYIEPSLLCSSVFGVEKNSADHQKRNINTGPASKSLIYNLSCLQNMLGQLWYKACASCQPVSDLI